MTYDKHLTVVVAEDNPGSMKNLLGCLESNPQVRILGTADNGEDAISLINSSSPDLVFLDVEMPGKNGFEVLGSLSVSPGIIFVTAHAQFAVKAFEVNGLDYIVKPVTQARVDAAIKKAETSMTVSNARLLEALSDVLPLKNNKKRFTVKKGDQIYIIRKDDVVAFKAEDKYVFLCTRDREYFYNATLKQLLKELDPDEFCKVSKSHIVAVDKIRKLKKNYKLQTCVVLDDDQDTTIPVSKNHLSSLKAKLSL